MTFLGAFAKRLKKTTQPRHVRLSAWKSATPTGRFSIKFIFFLLKFVSTFRPVKIGLKISLDEALRRLLQYLIIGLT